MNFTGFTVGTMNETVRHDMIVQAAKTYCAQLALYKPTTFIVWALILYLFENFGLKYLPEIHAKLPYTFDGNPRYFVYEHEDYQRVIFVVICMLLAMALAFQIINAGLLV